MNKLAAKKHKWSLEFPSRMKHDSNRLVLDTLPDPPGFSNITTNELAQRESKPDLIEKKSWDVALGPLKQIPMNLFIMWMAGNSISIFPIMMVGMMFIRPIQALVSIKQTFRMIEGKNSGIQKLVYAFGNLVGIGLATYKCHVMGLLPLHASDWLSFIEPQQRSEWSSGGYVL